MNTPMTLVLSAAIVLLAPSLSHAQASTADQNARTLGKYMVHQQITRLEWELLQFNLLWAGSYSTPGSYLNSYPVYFDQKAMRFTTVFGVSERRESQDPDPWSSLSRLKRESILQGAINQLRDLLAQTFPEVKSSPGVLLIEFRYRQGSGGFVNAARYDNGTLTLNE
ncbi:hypothetical protein AZOA_25540 [Azoarcus sp. Aa7]|nr:hypothetical protein [Azoarcus sp. Aa7]